MYSNAKIPEPFCCRAEAPHPVPRESPEARAKAEPPAVTASETAAAPEKTQASGSQPDTLPLLAFLLMEFFR